MSAGKNGFGIWSIEMVRILFYFGAFFFKCFGNFGQPGGAGIPAGSGGGKLVGTTAFNFSGMGGGFNFAS